MQEELPLFCPLPIKISASGIHCNNSRKSLLSDLLKREENSSVNINRVDSACKELMEIMAQRQINA